MIQLLAFLNLLISIYTVAKITKKNNIIPVFGFAIVACFSLYILVSAAFFGIDRFDMKVVLSTCLAVFCILTLFVAKRDGNFKIKIDTSFESYVPIVLIIILAIFFSWEKNELYSMGQDQGTYQVKAMALMSYDTHNAFTIPEYEKLDTDEERQKYLDFIYNQNNFYLPRVEWETEYDATKFEQIKGSIHGLPTYGAVLALWGNLFGLENMLGVQTWLYLAVLILVWELAEKLGYSRFEKTIVCLLMACSPIMIWLSKSSLTEMGIVLLVVLFLYFMSSENMSIATALPIVVFAFYHISLYAFMPIFVLIFLHQYYEKRDKGYLTALYISLGSFFLGSVWAFAIEPYYSYGNFSELTKITKGLITDKMMLPLISVACLTSVAIALLMSSRKLALCDKAERFLNGKHRDGIIFAARVVLSLFLIVSVLFFVYRGIIKPESHRACEYLQISAYIYLSGIIFIPALYIVLLIIPRLACRNTFSRMLLVLFLYTVVMYSMVMRVRVPYYYYFARYSALFLPVIFLLGLECMRAIDFVGVGKKKLIIVGFTLLALITFIPYDIGLPFQKDHSRCEWSFLQSITEYIDANSAVVIGPDEQQIIFIFPLKMLTGCDVYYADEQLESEIAMLVQKYPKVFYMDYDCAFEENYPTLFQNNEELKVKKVYTNWNHLSYLDYFNIKNPVSPIPIDYVEYKLKISLYEIEG